MIWETTRTLPRDGQWVLLRIDRKEPEFDDVYVGRYAPDGEYEWEVADAFSGPDDPWNYYMENMIVAWAPLPPKEGK